MRIDKKLNLVIPIDQDGPPLEAGGEPSKMTLYAHSTPLGHEVWRRYHLILAKVFARILSERLNVMSGPRVAMFMLEDIAQQMGIQDDVETGLVAEMRRLTNVVVPGPKGWSAVPLDVAIQKKNITPEEDEEVMNEVAFFTVFSAASPPSDLRGFLDSMCALWSTQLVSLNCTEYAASLRRLETETTGTGDGKTTSSQKSSAGASVVVGGR